MVVWVWLQRIVVVACASMMSDVVYPTTGWTSDLARLPRLSSADLNRVASSSGTQKGARRSYKLVTESYVVASSVRACYDQEMQVVASVLCLQCKLLRSHRILRNMTISGQLYCLRYNFLCALAGANDKCRASLCLILGATYACTLGWQ